MKTLTKKIIQIQQELNAPKSCYNSFGNYHYRNLENILEAVKPLLVREELLLNISDELVEKGDRYYIKAVATISDGSNSITSTAYAREAMVKKSMDEAQITGAASSYARKYALGGLFLIDDNQDPDTDVYTSASNNEAKPSKPKSKKVEKKTVETGDKPVDKEIVNNILAKFAEIEIAPQDIYKYLGIKSGDEIKQNHVNTLRAYYQAEKGV